MDIRLVGNRALVEPIPDEEVTPGGLVRPHTARARANVIRAKVLAVGSGKTVELNRQAVHVSPEVSPGDHVLITRVLGELVDGGLVGKPGTELRVVDCHEHILAVVDPDFRQ